MRVDNILDPEPRLVCRPDVCIGVRDRIDNGSCSFSAATEEIGNPDGINMKVLPEDHGRAPLFIQLLY
jgi:hypothetical protein